MPIAEKNGMRKGFSMTVEEVTAVGQMAAKKPETNPATGPPMSRASDQMTVTVAIPTTAIAAVTATGSDPPRRGGHGSQEVEEECAVMETALSRWQTEERTPPSVNMARTATMTAA